MKRVDKKLLALLLIAIIAISTTSILYTLFQGRNKGIKIVFKDVSNKNLIANTLSITKISEKVEVQVEATLPTGPNATETLFLGFLKDSKLFLNAENPKFKKVLEAWINLYDLEELKENLETSLIISLWIFNETGVYRPVPDIVVGYKPIEAQKDLVIKTVTIDPKTLKKVNQENSLGLRVKNGWRVFYRWKQDPELSWISTNYMKVPVLIVKNDLSYSATIGFSICIAQTRMTEFKITISYGYKIKDKAKNQQYASISLDIYSTGYSIKEKYSFCKLDFACPNVAKWVWIKAKPAHIHYKEYIVYMTGKEVFTGNEKIVDKILSVYTDGYDIKGGISAGLPSCIDWFFDGSVEENPKIPDTSLSDGRLDPGESIPFDQIFPYYDQYRADFEIGIPVGAIAAAALSSTPAAFIAPVISGLAISLSVGLSASTYVNGCLQNNGSYPVGYNVWERIYVRVSKYRYSYTCIYGSYLFKVPVGIYFRCW